MTIFGGFLSQDFERESLAKYKTSNASTFVDFDPLPRKEAEQQQVNLRVPKGRGTSFPRGRFTGPNNGRFTGPRGGFSFPAGNRFSAPTEFGGGKRFSWPADPSAKSTNGADRFTWPQNGNRNGFTQPGFAQPKSGFTWPQGNTNQGKAERFTSPLE